MEISQKMYAYTGLFFPGQERIWNSYYNYKQN